MTEKKSSSLSKLLIKLTTMSFSLFKIIPNFILLVELEARSAAKSITTLLIMYLIAGCLLTSSWLCLLAMCFVLLTTLQLSWLLSLFIILVINILILIITALLASNSMNKLTFEKTRDLLKHINQ